MRFLRSIGKKQKPAVASPRTPDAAGPYPAVVGTELEWLDVLQEMIGALPWFGEHVPPARATPRVRGEPRTSKDDQRLLLSWLAGGTKAQIGRRVGLSRRSVYNQVRRLIYLEEPAAMLAVWTRLGLIAVLCTPYCHEPRILWNQVACLVCHRHLGAYSATPPRPRVGQVYRAHELPPLLPGNAVQTGERVQAHLVHHFWLEDAPGVPGSLFHTTAWESVPSLVTGGRGVAVPTDDSFIMPLGGDGSKDMEEWQQWWGEALERTPRPPPGKPKGDPEP